MRDSVMIVASGAVIAPIDTADAHTPDFAEPPGEMKKSKMNQLKINLKE